MTPWDGNFKKPYDSGEDYQKIQVIIPGRSAYKSPQIIGITDERLP